MEFDKAELIGVIMALSSVVAMLWRINSSNQKKETERLQKCESMHDKSQEELKQVIGDYRELKGRMDGVEQLSKSVLAEIKRKTE